MGRVNAITFLSFPIRLVDLWKYEDLLSSFLCMQIAAHFNVNKRALKKGGGGACLIDARSRHDNRTAF